uniref:Prepronociceptin n=1 Tax=Neogobius melanostomus TaxID=47308 RepID=A0A8C6UVL7_9GOBI
MALVQSRAVWTLVLLSCLSLFSSSSADCGPECARCVYGLLGQQSALPPLACSLECGGALDAQILRSCGETLMENDSQLPLEDSPPEETSDPKEEEDMPEHLLAKKYGGFMKRYGGFMARRSPPHQKGAQRRPRALTASKTSAMKSSES